MLVSKWSHRLKLRSALSEVEKTCPGRRQSSCTLVIHSWAVWCCIWVCLKIGYIPNEIAIFHRDNDQQNHWVQWGTLFSDTPIFRYIPIVSLQRCADGGAVSGIVFAKKVRQLCTEKWQDVGTILDASESVLSQGRLPTGQSFPLIDQFFLDVPTDQQPSFDQDLHNQGPTNSPRKRQLWQSHHSVAWRCGILASSHQDGIEMYFVFLNVAIRKNKAFHRPGRFGLPPL